MALFIGTPLYGPSLLYAGPASLIWGYVPVTFFTWFVGFAMAEICSSFPVCIILFFLFLISFFSNACYHNRIFFFYNSIYYSLMLLWEELLRNTVTKIYSILFFLYIIVYTIVCNSAHITWEEKQLASRFHEFQYCRHKQFEKFFLTL